MRYASLTEFLEAKKEQYLSQCLICGKCLRICPIIARSAYKGVDPQDLQRDRIEFLRGGDFSQQVYDSAFLCMTCDLCVFSCPRELYPPLLNIVIQLELGKKGHKPPPFVHFILPDQKKGLMDLLMALQYKPSEQRWYSSPPEKPKKAEVVLFGSCYYLVLKDKFNTTLDVLERMGVDFVTLAGGADYCCAIGYVLAGNVEKAERVARNTVEAIASFQPKKAIVGCPTCIWWFKEICSHFMTYPFEFEHLVQFLAANLNKIPLAEPVKKTVTIHDACHLGRGIGEYEAQRKILQAIPGTRLVEMEHTRQNSLCCGMIPSLYEPSTGKKVTVDRLEEAKVTGADFFASICGFCHLTFAPYQGQYPFQIGNLIDLVGESLGIKYEDKLKKYWLCKDIDKIMEDAAETIKESSFTREEVRSMLPLVFS